MKNLNGGTVLGFIAIFIALSGGAYAAISLPKNSVRSKQVKDHSLLKRDFKRGQLPSGDDGVDGLDGAPGPQGPPGPTNTSALVKASGPQNTVCAAGTSCDVASSVANCPTGMKVVSGGFFNYSGQTEGEYSEASEDRTAWTAGVANGSSFGQGTVQAFAYCASTGAAVTASRRSTTVRTRQDVALAESRLRTMLHRSGCHGAHSCPSDHGTYRWRGLRCWKAGADDRPSSATRRVRYDGRTYYCKR